MKSKALIIPCIMLILCTALFLYGRSRLLSSGDAYAPPEKEASRLKALSIVKKADGLHLGRAWKKRIGGNFVLFVTGTPYEMGYQHGILLREEIKSGVVPHFADPISGIREHRAKPAWLKKLLMLYLQWNVYAPIERHSPRRYLEEIKGVADGAGMDYREIFIANMVSDLSMAMIPGVISKRAKELGLRAECSDFAASGGFTTDGRLIIGRNTDYSGIGRWMKYQTIFVAKPKEGYAYVRVETAGRIKCNSAMNVKGFTIGGHFMAYEGADPAGVSFTFLEHEIMRRASTLDEAISIVKNSRRGGSFGFMIGEGDSRQAAVVEATLSRIGVKKMNGETLALTNHALTEELKPFDIIARHNIIMRDCLGRYLRLEALLKENRGRIDPQRASEIMGDHIDPATGTERGTGITIGSSNNVCSVVFLPASRLFWVGTGREPACNNPFIGYDLTSLLEGSAPRVAPGRLSGYRWLSTNKEVGLRAYMKAFSRYEDNMDDLDGTLAHLARAQKLDPDEPIYPAMQARLLILRGEYGKAVKALDHSLRLKQSNNERALAHLLRGQALDLQVKRNEAVASYTEVLRLRERHGRDFMTGINDMVWGLATKYKRTPFTAEKPSDVLIGFGHESGLE